MKFDRQLRSATETSWVVSCGGKTIPRFEWPPFWESLYRHISVKNHSISMKFCTEQQILNWMNVTWSKMKKLHWTDSKFDRTYFLLITNFYSQNLQHSAVNNTHLANIMMPVVSLSNRWTRYSVCRSPVLSTFDASGCSNLPTLWCIPGPPSQSTANKCQHSSNNHTCTMSYIIHEATEALDKESRIKQQLTRNAGIRLWFSTTTNQLFLKVSTKIFWYLSFIFVLILNASTFVNFARCKRSECSVSRR